MKLILSGEPGRLGISQQFSDLFLLTPRTTFSCETLVITSTVDTVIVNEKNKFITLILNFYSTGLKFPESVKEFEDTPGMFGNILTVELTPHMYTTESFFVHMVDRINLAITDAGFGTTHHFQMLTSETYKDKETVTPIVKTTLRFSNPLVPVQGVTTASVANSDLRKFNDPDPYVSLVCFDMLTTYNGSPEKYTTKRNYDAGVAGCTATVIPISGGMALPDISINSLRNRTSSTYWFMDIIKPNDDNIAEVTGPTYYKLPGTTLKAFYDDISSEFKRNVASGAITFDETTGYMTYVGPDSTPALFNEIVNTTNMGVQDKDNPNDISGGTKFINGATLTPTTTGITGNFSASVNADFSTTLNPTFSQMFSMGPHIDRTISHGELQNVACSLIMGVNYNETFSNYQLAAATVFGHNITYKTVFTQVDMDIETPTEVTSHSMVLPVSYKILNTKETRDCYAIVTYYTVRKTGAAGFELLLPDDSCTSIQSASSFQCFYTMTDCPSMTLNPDLIADMNPVFRYGFSDPKSVLTFTHGTPMTTGYASSFAIKDSHNLTVRDPKLKEPLIFGEVDMSSPVAHPIPVDETYVFARDWSTEIRNGVITGSVNIPFDFSDLTKSVLVQIPADYYEEDTLVDVNFNSVACLLGHYKTWTEEKFPKRPFLVEVIDNATSDVLAREIVTQTDQPTGPLNVKDTSNIIHTYTDYPPDHPAVFYAKKYENMEQLPHLFSVRSDKIEFTIGSSATDIRITPAVIQDSYTSDSHSPAYAYGSATTYPGLLNPIGPAYIYPVFETEAAALAYYDGSGTTVEEWVIDSPAFYNQQTFFAVSVASGGPDTFFTVEEFQETLHVGQNPHMLMPNKLEETTDYLVNSIIQQVTVENAHVGDLITVSEDTLGDPAAKPSYVPSSAKVWGNLIIPNGLSIYTGQSSEPPIIQNDNVIVFSENYSGTSLNYTAIVDLYRKIVKDNPIHENIILSAPNISIGGLIGNKKLNIITKLGEPEIGEIRETMMWGDGRLGDVKVNVMDVTYKPVDSHLSVQTQNDTNLYLNYMILKILDMQGDDIIGYSELSENVSENTVVGVTVSFDVKRDPINEFNKPINVGHSRKRNKYS